MAELAAFSAVGASLGRPLQTLGPYLHAANVSADKKRCSERRVCMIITFEPFEALPEPSGVSPPRYTDIFGMVSIQAAPEAVELKGVFGHEFARALMTAAIRMTWFPKASDRLEFSIADVDEEYLTITYDDANVVLDVWGTCFRAPRDAFVRTALDFYSFMADLIDARGGRANENFNFEWLRRND